MRGSIDLDTDTIKLMLTAGSGTPGTYAPSQQNDVSRANASAFEATVAGGTGGYSAGGWTLTTPTVAAAHPTVNWDAADMSFGIGGTMSFRYGIYYKSSGAAATDWLIGYVDFGGGGSQTVINATVNITQTNQLAITVS